MIKKMVKVSSIEEQQKKNSTGKRLKNGKDNKVS